MGHDMVSGAKPGPLQHRAQHWSRPHHAILKQIRVRQVPCTRQMAAAGTIARVLAGELTARFDGRAVAYGFGELDALVPAYAATIHKSQGSEYPAVVIPVLTQHYAMLQRNLLYTGVTRGKRLVVLVGQKKAVAIAVRNVSGRRRWSKLNEWLAGPMSAFPPKQHVR